MTTTTQMLEARLHTVLTGVKRTVLKIAQIEGDISIKRNFAAQGRPEKWKKKKRPDGRSILTGKSGNLLRTINSAIDYSIEQVLFGSDLIYSKVHNEGLEIPKRKGGSVKKGGSVFKSKSKSTGGTIKMPKREFLVIPEMDWDRILSSIKMGINLQLK